MEIVLVMVMCSLFGFWVWNLKSDLNELQKRLDDEGSRIVMVYGPIRSAPTKARAPIKESARSVFHDDGRAWTTN